MVNAIALKQKSYRPHTTVEAALWLNGMGLNVIPFPIASKTPYANGHKMFLKQWGAFYQRLGRDGLRIAFAGECNIAVIMGRTSGNLFVVDCESPDSFKYHLGETAARNIPVFAAKTARGGHLYFKMKEGIVQPMGAGTMEKFGFNQVEIRGGSSQYVITPPSIHDTGVKYEWCGAATEIPTVTKAQVDWLPISIKSRWHTDTEDYLASGHVYPEGCRNDSLYRTAHDMAFRGENRNVIHHRLQSIATNSGLQHREVPRTIENGIRNGQQKSGQVKLNIHDGLTIFCAEYNGWTGRTGNTDRAVFEALIQRSKRDNRGKGYFRATMREIAELAKVTAKTAHASLHRLADAGFIERVNDVSKGQSSCWKFSEEIIRQSKEKLRNSQNYHTNGVAYKRHTGVVITQNPLAERKALGKTAARVLNYLQQVGKTSAQEIADALNLSIHQVYRALSKAKLRAHSLIEQVKHGVWGICKHIKRTLSELTDAGQIAGSARRDHHKQERKHRLFDRILRFRLKTDSAFAQLWHTKFTPMRN